MGKTIYRYNIVAQFFILICSLWSIFIALFTINKNYQEAIAGKLTTIDYMGLTIISPLIGMLIIFGIVGFVMPLANELEIGENGLRYQTITHTIEADWNETRYQISSGLQVITPHWGKVSIKPWAKYLPYKIHPLDKGILLSWLGTINSKKLVEQIHRFAPYLFHETRTVREFALALNALDSLVYKCINLNLPFEKFIYQYWSIEYRCNFAEDVANIELLKYLQKHADRIQPHRLIYEEIVKPILFYEENNGEEGLDTLPGEPMGMAEGLAILQAIAAKHFSTSNTSP